MVSDLTLYGIGAVPLIVALVEVIKETGLPARLAPVAALLLGIVAGEAAQATLTHPVWIQGGVIGVAAGLAASGIYSGVSAFVQPKETILSGTISTPVSVLSMPPVSTDSASAAPASK